MPNAQTNLWDGRARAGRPLSWPETSISSLPGRLFIVSECVRTWVRVEVCMCTYMTSKCVQKDCSVLREVGERQLLCPAWCRAARLRPLSLALLFQTSRLADLALEGGGSWRGDSGPRPGLFSRRLMSVPQLKLAPSCAGHQTFQKTRPDSTQQFLVLGLCNTTVALGSCEQMSTHPR